MSFIDSTSFTVGANLPWIGYGTDVGASAWYPAGGLSVQPAALDLLDRTLSALARDRISLVRTFLLCDARSGLRFDPEGLPGGLDDSIFRDMDAMVSVARRHRIRLMPALFDFHLCARPRTVDGVQLGGRSRVIHDPAARAALVDRVVRPIVERYCDEDALAAWDVMNEPEWCLGIGPRHIERVPFDALQHFLGDAVDCVRRFARQPVTIGSAGTFGLDLVRPLDIDFYQVHWYDRFGWRALEQPVTELGVGNRPMILGEFAGRSPRVAEVLDAAKRAGYAGALVWSLLAGDEQSAYPPDLVAWARTKAGAPQDA